MLEAAEHQLAAVHLAPVNLLQHLALGVVIALLETVPSALGTGSRGTEQVLKQLRFTFLCIQRVGLVSHGVSPCCKRERQMRGPMPCTPSRRSEGGGANYSFLAETIFTGCSGTFCIMVRLPVGTWAIWSTTSMPRTTLANTA